MHRQIVYGLRPKVPSLQTLWGRHKSKESQEVVVIIDIICSKGISMGKLDGDSIMMTIVYVGSFLFVVLGIIVVLHGV